MKNTNKGQGHVFFLTLISLILLLLLIISSHGIRHKKKARVVKLKPICTETGCTQTYAKQDPGADYWLYYNVLYSAGSTPDSSTSASKIEWTRSDKAPNDEEIEQDVDEDLTDLEAAPESDPEANADMDADVDGSDSDSFSDSDSSSDSFDSSADSSFDGGGDFGGGDAGGGDGGGGE